MSFAVRDRVLIVARLSKTETQCWPLIGQNAVITSELQWHEDSRAFYHALRTEHGEYVYARPCALQKLPPLPTVAERELEHA